MFPSPSSMAPTMSDLAVVAASLPSGGRIVFGPEWKAGLVDFHQSPTTGCARASTMQGAQLVRRAAKRCGKKPIPSCFWSCRAEMPLEWVAIR